MGVLRVLLDHKGEIFHSCLVLIYDLIGLCSFVDITDVRGVFINALNNGVLRI